MDALLNDIRSKSIVNFIATGLFSAGLAGISYFSYESDMVKLFVWMQFLAIPVGICVGIIQHLANNFGDLARRNVPVILCLGIYFYAGLFCKNWIFVASYIMFCLFYVDFLGWSMLVILCTVAKRYLPAGQPPPAVHGFVNQLTNLPVNMHMVG